MIVQERVQEHKEIRIDTTINNNKMLATQKNK